MGHLLAALHLPPLPPPLKATRRAARGPSKKTPSPVAAPEMEMVEDKGARWTDREVDEQEIAAFMAGVIGRIDKPARATRGGPPEAPAGIPAAEPSKPAGTSVQIPVSLSIKLGKKFKYVEIEKLKIEGELKFEDTGEAGIVKTADVIGVSLDKGKLAPAKKVEIDLKKLKDLLLGQVHEQSANASVKVDPKLECKVGPGELSVALGISVSAGWYAGSAKLVVVARESGKDWEFASFQVAPIGAQFKDKPIDLSGVKGKVSGKLSIGLVLKPEWGAIGVDVATRVGRPVLTALAEAATAEAAIAAGFVAGAAATVFAYTKAVGDWRDVRDGAEAAENGWLSFRAGFGSAYGLKWPDGGSAELHKQGAAAAAALLDARLATSRKQALAEHGALPPGFDAEWRATMKEVAAKNPDGLGLWVQRNFRGQIMEGFLRAYAQEHGDDYQYQKHARALRTLLGVSR